MLLAAAQDILVLLKEQAGLAVEEMLKRQVWKTQAPAVVDKVVLKIHHQIHLDLQAAAVPVSFSSHILHKYSKNTKWA
jgi:hypothetical protein